MNELSIFIDESGDFGEYKKYSPYYVISLVMHEQSNDISNQISQLNSKLNYLKLDNRAIHTEPLIRREENYNTLNEEERRKILVSLYYFAIKCEIKFKTFVYEKYKYKEEMAMESMMAKDITQFLDNYKECFNKFDKIIIYYDNGQKNINRLINFAFVSRFDNCDRRKVFPNEYKLFQVADLICTLELIRNKIKTRELSRSERLIFHTKNDFKKDFIKKLWKKEFCGEIIN